MKSPTQNVYRVSCSDCGGLGYRSQRIGPAELCESCGGNGAILIPDKQPWSPRRRMFLYVGLVLIALCGLLLWIGRP